MNNPNIEAIQSLLSGSPDPVILSKYLGWGKYAKLLLDKDLNLPLTAQEIAALKASVLSAYYTTDTIASHMWRYASHYFKGRAIKILEPGCGSGRILAAMPKDLAVTETVGVELEPIAARIAQILHPKAKIYPQCFGDFTYPDNYFDLVVGNVPYGQFKLNETRYAPLGASIHDHFLCKSADLLKPGGMMVVLTSPYTLNRKDSKVREYLADRLALVSAVALPEGTFREMGTDCAEHLLVFIKDPNADYQTEPWLDAEDVAYYPWNWGKTGESHVFPLNEYFHSEFHTRPNSIYNRSRIRHILGTPCLNSLYGDGFSVESDPSLDVGQALEAVFTDDQPRLDRSRSQDFECDPLPPAAIIVPPHLSHVKNYEYLEDAGKFYQRIGAYLNPVPKRMKVKGGRKFYEVEVHDRLRDYWNLSRAVKLVIAAQSSAEDLKVQQACLQVAYDRFFKNWGLLKSPTFDPDGKPIKRRFNENEAVLRDQPDYQITCCAETDAGTKSALFEERVTRSFHPPDFVTDIEQAIAVCRNVRGKLDIDYLSELTRVGKTDLTQFLSKHLIVFYDPALDTWIEREEYLSGNVRRKLVEAKGYEGIYGVLNNNIEALIEVLPLPVLPPVSDELKVAMLERLGTDWESLDQNEKDKLFDRQIRARLGSDWINDEIYTEFALRIGIRSAKVKRIPEVGVFSVDGYSHDTTQYGTEYRDSREIFDLTINQKPIQVNIYNSDKTLDIPKTEEATIAARECSENLKAAFLDWLWSDDDRAMDLYLRFNSQVNVFVPRRWDGSFLELPGSNPQIVLRPWQKNWAYQILSSRSTFIDGDVGTGKTFGAIAGIMECRRIGLAKKPIYVALNGTEKQIYKDFKRLYPAARVLMFDSVGADARNRFMASLVAADFDCVILTHSQFFLIAMGEDYQVAYYLYMRGELESIKVALQRDTRSNVASKRVEARIKNLTKRINDLNGQNLATLEKELEILVKAGKEKEAKKVREKITRLKNRLNGIKFEALGIDMIVFDEIHVAKNLEVSTMLGSIKGIPTAHSQRALDTYQKLLFLQDEFLEELVNDKFKGIVVGMTGTTISNTIGELFNWMRMFLPRLMREQGINHFDSWVSRFSELSETFERNLKGQWGTVYRFKSFHNFEVLTPLLRQFMSTVTFEEIASDLKRPTPTYITEIVDASPWQRAFMELCVKRAYRCSTGQVDPREDNPLTITTDINKAALTPRLFNTASEWRDSKLHRACFNIWKIWTATKSVKGVQLVFCDFSTPKSDKYNVYAYCKNILLALGIPPEEIGFIHDYTDNARVEFLERVNRGEVRVVFGSSAKLGTGVNAHQAGCWAIHHLDAPWVPTAITQREGRAIRQGNGELLLGDGECIPRVWDFKYITRNMEVGRWQTLQAKQEMVASFRRQYDLSQIKDIDSEAMSYEMIKAESSGSPLLQEMAKLQNRKKELKVKQKNHSQKQVSLSVTAKNYQSAIKAYNFQIDGLEFEIERLKNECDPDTAPVTFNKADYTDRRESAKAIAGAISDFSLNSRMLKGQAREVIATFCGFALTVYLNALDRIEFKLETRNCVIDLPLKIWRGDQKITIHWERNKPDEMIPSLIGIIKLLPDHLDYIRGEQRALSKELLRIEDEKRKSFDFGSELVEIEARIREIEANLTEEGLETAHQIILSETDFDSHQENPDADDWYATIGAENADLTSSYDPVHVEYIKSWEDPEWLGDIQNQVMAVQLEKSFRLS